MTIFDDDSIDLPPVRVTPLEDDEEGRSLLDRLEALQEQKESAQAEAREAGRPLADLLAEADELAARALVGDVDPDEADEAEAEARATKERIEEARRQVKQCERASAMVREKIEERARDLYAENADAVRSVHRILVRHALEAERRAAQLLRVLREFEAHYARYTSGDHPEPHPQYLKEQERTSPPRAVMGPARTPGGNVFNSTEATLWMHRAADAVDAEPPAVLDVASLDFESDDATPSFVRPEEIDEEPTDAAAVGNSGPAAESEPSNGTSDAVDDGAPSDIDATAPTDEAEAGAPADAADPAGVDPPDADPTNADVDAEEDAAQAPSEPAEDDEDR